MQQRLLVKLSCYPKAPVHYVIVGVITFIGDLRKMSRAPKNRNEARENVIGQTIFFLSFHFFVRKTTKPFFFFFKFWHYSGFHGEKKDGKKKYIG